MAGGSRPGAGRKRKYHDGREWWRKLVDDPVRREQVAKNLDADLTAGRLDSYFKAFEYGYGRPGPDVTVNVSADGQHVSFAFPGQSGPSADLPAAATGLPVAGADEHGEG